jgi:hypothetical protein
MPPGIWVAALMILLPALLYVPVHFLLHRSLCRSRCARGERRSRIVADVRFRG